MPLRQRVARRLGDAVSSDFDSTSAHDPPKPPSTPPSPNKENVEQQQHSNKKKSRKTSTAAVDKTPGKRATTGKSAQGGSGAITAAAKRTKQKGRVLAEPDANKVTKRTGAVGNKAKKPYEKKTYQRVTRATRSNTRLTDQLSPDSKPVLDYFGCRLTQEDIRTLKSDWLGDNNIHFWEEWLDREILPKYPQARIALIRPSISFMIMQQMGDPRANESIPKLDKVTHIFMPVNDSDDPSRPGGSHWSLLLVSTIDGVAFHYDSLGGHNNPYARKCAQQLSRILGKPLRFQWLDDCPQQENGSDCGVFVCIIMRHLLVKRLLNANAKEKVSMSMANKAIDSQGGRKEMLRIIESLRKEAERRRSASPNPAARSENPPKIE